MFIRTNNKTALRKYLQHFNVIFSVEMGICYSSPSTQTQSDAGTRIYDIIIKTGDAYANAGTDATVSINLIGAKGDQSTGWVELDHFLRNDFEKGQTDHFRRELKDVGIPKVIRIRLTNKYDHWLCQTIVIKVGGETAYFPIYDWILTEMRVTTGQAMLPQNVTNPNVKSMREKEIEINKALFEWIPRPTPNEIGWGLPRYVNATSYNSLPYMFRREEVRSKNLIKSGFTAGVNFLLEGIFSKVVPLKDLESFHRLHAFDELRRQNNDYLENWKTDEVMGYQVLTGISPLAFKRCICLPDYFLVTNDDVSRFMRNGRSLEDEMKAGRVYISDYTELLHDVERNTAGETDELLHCPECVGMFYVNHENKFLPIAIQLVPDDRDYLFTPDCSDDDWLLAKMFFRTAQGNVHEWIYHYLLTHSITEPFATSLFRCLPKSHPVYKLLRPHLQTVPAMNTDARATLIAPKSKANQTVSLNATSLARKYYKNFRLEDIVIPKVLKKNGTDDPNLLPNYHYRDDAMELWKSIEKYCTDVLSHYYKSNEDVTDDFELQGWARDVATEGLGWMDGQSRGMPEKMESMEQLMEICVLCIFTSSAQHAAVNFGQFETYKFAPNCPLGMRLPPHKRGEATMERIMNTLPDFKMASTMIAVTFVLSDFSPDDTYLGTFTKKLFCEQPVLDMQAAYKKRLEELEKKIEERNKELEKPYIFLLPSRVPNYIAI